MSHPHSSKYMRHQRVALWHLLLLLFTSLLLPFAAFAQLAATNDPTDYSTIELGNTQTKTIQLLNYAPKIPSFDLGLANIACAIEANNTVKCWGDNGAAGKLSTDGKEARPQKTPYPTVTSTGEPLKLVQVSMGYSHSCGVTSTGAMKCWGYVSGGALGGSTYNASNGAIDIPEFSSGVVKVAVGASFECALMKTGGVKCMGINDQSQLGDGTTTNRNYPVDVLGLTNGVLDISAGNSHVCALLTDKTVKCWGTNNLLGNGNAQNDKRPALVTGITGATQITTGATHSCAVLQDGTAKCWGDNTSGKLGDATSTDRTIPVTVNGLTNAVQLTGGNSHTCALINTGDVKCWGNSGSMTPTLVTGLAGKAVAVDAGVHVTCAQLETGALQCWGSNAQGLLGNGTTTNSTTPVNVTGYATGGTLLPASNTDITLSSISITGTHPSLFSQTGGTCTATTVLSHDQSCTIEMTFTGSVRGTKAALLEITSSDAKVPVLPVKLSGVISKTGDYLWGGGAAGSSAQISATANPTDFGSIPSGGNSARTVTVSNLASAGSAQAPNFDVGMGYAACAIEANNAVKCWGDNGARGKLSTDNKEARPQTTPYPTVTSTGDPLSLVQVSMGYNHGCGVTSAGAMKCWGWNAQKQIGPSIYTEDGAVDAIGFSSGVVKVAAGLGFHCALMKTGGVKCIGTNTLGELGDGTTSAREYPVDVLGLNIGVLDITAGYSHSCALLSDHTVKCWGENVRLGNNNAQNDKRPALVTGLNGVVQVAAGYDHTCALLNDGTVQCWGDNTYQQLGDGTSTERRVPVVAQGLSNVVQITGGAAHTCALINTGEVQCWGTHQDGTPLILKTVAGLKGKVVAIDAGIHTDCAQLDTGALQCWGHAQSGLLGNGTSTIYENSALVNGEKYPTGVAGAGLYVPHAVDVTGYATGGTLLASSGGADLTLSGLGITGTDSNLFTKTGGSCTTSTILPPSDSCTIDLVFSGVAAGNKAASLDIASNDTLTPLLPVALTGIVTVTNTPPVITSNGGGDTATVNVAANQTAVTTVTATDANPADVLMYSITGGADAAKFAIDANTGVLTFVAASTVGSYEVIVKVDDGKGGTDTQTLTVVADKDTDGDGLFDSIDQDDDNDGLPDLGECKFGKPVGGLPISLLNEGFELPVQTAQLSFPLNGQVPGWITSATDNSFEFWRDSFLSVPAYEGHQHVELNAYEVSTLYQKIATKPGDVLQWSFAHRGREGDDTIALHIGAEGAALDASNKQGEYTTGNTAWKVYTGTYTVPAGQTVTQFAYKSVSAAGGNPEVGNFLDAISFSLLPPCTAADVDSDGIPNMNDLDSDNDGIPDNIEAQTTAGYKVPTGTVDANGIDTAYGTGLTLVDTDGDLTPDFVDTNTDNAQTDDTTEAGLTLASKDSDGDGLDDAVDSDDAKFGPANAGITNVLTTYPAAGGEVGWRTTVATNIAPNITSNSGNALAVNVAENSTATVTDVEASDTEDGAEANLTYSLSGADAALFSIGADGKLVFKSPADFETPTDVAGAAAGDNVYEVTVTVTDNASGKDTQTITVTVTDVDEVAPTLTIDTVATDDIISAAEAKADVVISGTSNAEIGQTVTLTLNGKTYTGLVIGDDTNNGVRWSITIPAADVAALTDGALTITANVSDVAGNAATPASHDITVTLNTAPTFTSPAAATFNENATSVVLNVEVTDDTSKESDATITYSLIGTDDDARFSIAPITGEITFKQAPDYETPADKNADNAYTLTVKACDADNACTTQTIIVNVTDVNEDLVLHVRGILQGAYNEADGLMRDDLRVLGLIPTAQSYSNAVTSLGYVGTETTTPAVLATTGNDAPVDWVVVELRDKTTPKTVVARVAALLQRDGDVVNPQTNEAKLLIPNVAAGQYFVTLRHRNHLGVMTQDAVTLSPTLTTIDFGLTTQTVSGANARFTSGTVAMLWAGDANNSDSVIATGPGNDANTVVGTILMHPSNVLANSNFLLDGYDTTDLNMDGLSIYAGPDNDINLLLGNVLLHPTNTAIASNYIIKGTLPK